MNAFDIFIITFLNQFARHSYVFDKIVATIAGNNLFKGGLMAAIIWMLWFTTDKGQSKKRERIVATLTGSIIAIGLARIMAALLPFRYRPMHEDALNFVFPYGYSPVILEGWSSFPSDHAVLFVAVAVGLIFVSNKVGFLSLLYTIFLILLPRIYLGLHWPTDIIVGGLIGAAIAILCNVFLVKCKCIQSITNISNSHPALFYPLFFLLTYQLADLFDSARALLSAVLKFFNIDL